MAVGDVKSGLSSIASAAFLDIQPPGTDEWVIHNIYHEDAVTLEFYDGTNSLAFDSSTAKGVYANMQFHVTNARRIRVKNAHASAAKLIGYDGVQTR